MAVDAERGAEFINEIIKVYKKFHMSISHEDKHGAFLIEPYNEVDDDWLRSADYGRYFSDEDIIRTREKGVNHSV